MTRNFGYYGNNRLQNQTNSRNLYTNNTNAKQIINNPQNSNGNASIFNTYHEGSQTTYTRGLVGETVSLGGIFGIPAVPVPVTVPVTVPIVPTCPEKICDGGTFTTNAELEILRGCTIINGNTTITLDVTDLSVFDCLNTVNGNFRIIFNPSLTSISINSLRTVTGVFYIHDNEALTSILFNSLITTGEFSINNNAIISILGFNSLNTVNGDFKIQNHTLLTSISGFNSLTTTGNFLITNNTLLTSISGFNSLTPVTGIGNVNIDSNGLLNICLSTYNKIYSARGTNEFMNTESFTHVEC